MPASPAVAAVEVRGVRYVARAARTTASASPGRGPDARGAVAAQRRAAHGPRRHPVRTGRPGELDSEPTRLVGQKACRDGFTAYFAPAAQLFRELELARADGSYAKRLRALGQVDVLIVDDWAMAPMAELERRAFLEICDERYLTRSTLLTSQLPVAKWHAQIGDHTVADSILDRLVHAAHRIELQGESMRKKKGGRGSKDGE